MTTAIAPLAPGSRASVALTGVADGTVTAQLSGIPASILGGSTERLDQVNVRLARALAGRTWDLPDLLLKVDGQVANDVDLAFK